MDNFRDWKWPLKRSLQALLFFLPPVFVLAQTFHGLGFFRGIKSQQGTGDSYLNNPNHVRIVDGGSATLSAGYVADTLWVQNGATVIISGAVTIKKIIVAGNSTLNVNADNTFEQMYCLNGNVTATAYHNTYTGAAWNAPSPGAGNGHLKFSVTGTTYVASGCAIHMDAKGYTGGVTGRPSGGSPTAAPLTTSLTKNGGASGGTNNQYGAPSCPSYGARGVVRGRSQLGELFGASDFKTALYMGPGAGYGHNNWVVNTGGWGGGALDLTLNNLTVVSGGRVSSKGGAGSGGYAVGGAGGTVVLNVTTLNVSGTGAISVAGGAACTTSYGRGWISGTNLIDGSGNVSLVGIDGLTVEFGASDVVNTLSVGAGNKARLKADPATVINDVVITGAGELQLTHDIAFNSVAVTSGTLSAPDFDNLFTGTTFTYSPGAGNGKLIFSANTVSVGATGIIHMDGKGYRGGDSEGASGGSNTAATAATEVTRNGGASGGINSQYGTSSCPSYGVRGWVGGRTQHGTLFGADNFKTELYLGPGTGRSRNDWWIEAGGRGGGAIKITAGTITVASGGKISAIGADGNGGYSIGGAGGTIVLDASSSFTNAGTVTVAGFGGCAGSYGRAWVSGSKMIDGSGNVSLVGLDGVTVEFGASDVVNNLNIGAGNKSIIKAAVGAVINDVTITGGGELQLGQEFTFDDVAVTSGKLSAPDFDNIVSGTAFSFAPGVGNGRLIFTAATVTVGATGHIHMDAKGYRGGDLEGAAGGSNIAASSGAEVTRNGGASGGVNVQSGSSSCPSYGTRGTVVKTQVGNMFGASDFKTELYLGPGTGYSRNNWYIEAGGRGGGAIKITAGTMSIASGGKITSNGGAGNGGYSLGGGGGTIVLDVSSSFSNAGSVSVAGNGSCINSYGRAWVSGSKMIDGSGNVSLVGLDGVTVEFGASDVVNNLNVGAGNKSIITAAVGAVINDVTITGGGELLLGQEFTFDDVAVTNGKLSAPQFDNIFTGTTFTNTPGVGNGKLIFSAATVTVGASGHIQMDAKGYRGGDVEVAQGSSPVSVGTGATSANGGGGGYSGVASGSGGSGGYGNAGYTGSGAAGIAYGISDFTTELYLGSGGGRSNNSWTVSPGGLGGGAIKISTPTLTIVSGGKITADAGFGSGGWEVKGSGGTIVLDVSTTFTNAGTVTAIGQSASQGVGRIHVPMSSLLDASNNLTPFPGSYIFDLDVNVNTLTVGANTEVTLSINTGSVQNMVVNGTGAVVNLAEDITFGGDVTVTSGTVTSGAYDNLVTNSTTWTNAPAPNNGQLKFTVTGTLTVGASGVIHMDAKGYGGGISTKTQGGAPRIGSVGGPGTSSASPNGGGGGAGSNSPNPRAGGGSYATHAGAAQSQGMSDIYGASDYLTQLYLGSGGGYDPNLGGIGAAGGGAIKITAANLTTISGGRISAKGASGTGYAGASSGGTLVLDVSGTFTNAGTLSVAGGTSANGGAGGYGRMWIKPASYIDGSNNITLAGTIEGLDFTTPASASINTITLGSGVIAFWNPGASTTVSTFTVNGTLSAYPFDKVITNSTTWATTPAHGNGQLILSATTVNVGATGVIHMDGMGYPGGVPAKTQGGAPRIGSVGGPGDSTSAANGGGGSPGLPRAGGASYATFGAVGQAYEAGRLYGASDYLTELYMGSGGGGNSSYYGTGGSGGGALKITATSLSVAAGGRISSKGVNGINYGAAGSGGTVVLDVSTSFSNSGTLSVAGGVNADNGSGGYGRMWVNPTSLISSGNISTGLADGLDLQIPDGQVLNTVTIGAATGSVGVVFWHPLGNALSGYDSTSFNLTVAAKGTLMAYPFDNVITDSTTWTNAPANGNGQLLLTAASVTVNGTISMDGHGYGGGNGLKSQGGAPRISGAGGPGTTSTSPNGGGGGGGSGGAPRGGGGSYHTVGTVGQSAAVSSVYGATDFVTEMHLGSGGGGSNSTYFAYGGAGGGSIKIVANALTINTGGIISSKGAGGYNYGGGGSGGTLILDIATSVVNTGSVVVTGGAGSGSAGNGGFGRIYIPINSWADGAGVLDLTYYPGYHTFDLVTALDTLTVGANTEVVLTTDVGGSIQNLNVNGASAIVNLPEEITFGNNVTVTNGLIRSGGFHGLSTAGAWNSPAPGVNNGQLVFTVTNTLTVGASGIINMDYKGYPAGGGVANTTSGGGTAGANGVPSSGGTYGSLGAEGGYLSNLLYGESDYKTALHLGSGGGSAYGGTGGAGGGAIKITGGTLVLASGSQITAKGGNSTGGYASGGSGGTVVLDFSTVTQNGGTVTVAGGTGTRAGGYGRMYIPLAALKDGSGNVSITNMNYLHLELGAADAINTLTVSTSGVVLLKGAVGADINTVSIINSGILTLANEWTFDDVTVTSGTLTAQGFDRSYDSGTKAWNTPVSASNGQLIMTVNNTLTVAAAGRINMDGKGYPGGRTVASQGGSPAGRGISSNAANGGGGGGNGGNGAHAGGGSYGTYGTSGTSTRGDLYGAADFKANLWLGSGGGLGYSSQGGADGGGAIKITAGTLSIASGGQITANGNSSTSAYAKAGSGGTVYLILGTLTNTGGAIFANGGTASGGKGRMAIDYTNCSGSYCPAAGNAQNTTYYSPIFSQASYCTLNGAVQECISDDD